MKMRSLSSWLMPAAVLLGMCGCKGKGVQPPAHGDVDVACDASFANIMDQVIDVFEYSYRNQKREVDVIPFYVSQKAAIDSLLSTDNFINTVVVGRELTKEETTRLRNRKLNPRTEKIAVDAVALIVNKQNDIPELTMNELRQILSGEVMLWDDVYPSRLDTIRVVFDQNGSSLIDYMRDKVNGGKPFGGKVYAENSSAEVFETVNRLKGAIGVIGVSWISTDMNGVELTREELRERSEKSDVNIMSFNPDVRVLPIREDDEVEAYKPYQQYIYDGRYPLHRPVYMITTAPTGSWSRAFFTYVTSSQGQKVILMTGVLPARKEVQVYEL